jgi:hypothetical protein
MTGGRATKGEFFAIDSRTWAKVADSGMGWDWAQKAIELLAEKGFIQYAPSSTANLCRPLQGRYGPREGGTVPWRYLRRQCSGMRAKSLELPRCNGQESSHIAAMSRNYIPSSCCTGMMATFRLL